MSGDQSKDPTRAPAQTRPPQAGPASWRGTHGSGAKLRQELKALRREHKELLRGMVHLQRAAQAGLLAGGLAHDVANLLCTVTAGAQLALESEDAEQHRRALARSLAFARRAEDALREFTRLTKGAPPRTEAVRVSEVLREAHALVRHALRREDVAFVRRSSTDDRALCNRTLLLQTVLNLLLNAVNAMRGRGGLIEVRVARYGSRIWLEVEDDGPGVPAEIEDRIFEPFVTGTTSDSSEPVYPCEGATAATGLGLYIGRRVVEEMGGTLTFGTAKGRGAIFRVTLLAADARRA